MEVRSYLGGPDGEQSACSALFFLCDGKVLETIEVGFARAPQGSWPLSFAFVNHAGPGECFARRGDESRIKFMVVKDAVFQCRVVAVIEQIGAVIVDPIDYAR